MTQQGTLHQSKLPEMPGTTEEQRRSSDAREWQASFCRENVRFFVYPKARLEERLIWILRRPERRPALLYCISRKEAETLAAKLRAEGCSALPYHAGFGSDLRAKTLEQFLRNDIAILAATSPLGIGIAKRDIRTIVHMNVPRAIEHYERETRLGGRDGKPCDCVLFYGYGDRRKQEYFIDRMEDVSEQQTARQNLQRMVRYTELRTCRRAYLLSSLGRDFGRERCDRCDRCLRNMADFDATDVVRKILCAVLRTGERFGTAHIASILSGERTERISKLRHDQLSIFGIVTEFGDEAIREIIGDVIAGGLLERFPGQYPTLAISEAGQRFLTSGARIALPKPDVEG